MTYIYLVENCYGDSNKVYIGKEKFPKKGKVTRKYNHKKTYGNQIIFTNIDEINSNLKKDWKPLETYWIYQFRTWGFDVQNKNDGGGGANEFTPKQCQKISMAKKGISNFKLKGIKQTDKRIKDRISKINWKLYGNIMSNKNKNKPQLKLRKPIYQMDLNNNIIKEWSGQKEAADTLKIDQGSISKCLLKNPNFTAGGFKWKFKND